MPQRIAYRVVVRTTRGHVYETNPLTTLAGDGVKPHEIFNELADYIWADWAQARAAGKVFDVRSIREHSGLTGINPDVIESIDVDILKIMPAEQLDTDIADSIDYDQRLAERFANTDEPPTTQEAVEGSNTLQQDDVSDGGDRVVLDGVPATD